MPDPTTTVDFQVMLFASLKEKAGRAAVPVTVPSGARVADLLTHLREAEPAIAPYLEATRVAVNLEFAPGDRVLTAGDQVALIPPVGGG